jgi:hypothetical protein
MQTLRLIQAFQYADSHGEVCPSTWKKPGDPTIKPDPDKVSHRAPPNASDPILTCGAQSKEYFKQIRDM